MGCLLARSGTSQSAVGSGLRLTLRPQTLCGQCNEAVDELMRGGYCRPVSLPWRVVTIVLSVESLPPRIGYMSRTQMG